MIKIMGAVLIISAGVVNGVKAAKKLRDRVKILQSLFLSAAQIRAEINTRLSSVTDILKKMALSPNRVVSELYKKAYTGMLGSDGEAFSVIWRRAVDSSPELLLRDDEKSALYEMGMCLGKYDAKSQDTLLGAVIEKLGHLEKCAEEELKNELRLQTGLSVISGVFVVIVLL